MLKDHFHNVPNNLCPSCVEEWDSWLGEVSDVQERKRITSDLKKVGSTEFHSSHLELYFHHFFNLRGFGITWHPAMEGVGTHPEFLLQQDSGSIFFEARISQQEVDFREQEEFCRLLKSELEELALPCYLSFETDQKAPPLSMFSVVRDIAIQFVEQNFKTYIQENALERNTYFRFPLRGSQYGIHFTFQKFPEGFPDGDSRVDYFIGGSSGAINKIFQNIEEKASKYGKPDQPLVIGIEVLDVSDKTIEKGVLYGMPSLILKRDSEGSVVDTKESNTYDGIFFATQDGNLKYEHVSAVVFYQYISGGSHHEHVLRIYHNPFATNPVDRSIFAGYQQFLPVEEGKDKGRMEWTTAISTD